MSAPRDLTQAAPSTSEHTVWCRGERFRRYLDAETIQTRIREIGTAISQDYDDATPILIGVLNGAFMFIADLMRAIEIDCEIDFMKLSSYGAAKVSSGDVTELKKIDANLEGRHVIIVEDIVDTGLSMEFILERMALHDPASVRVATLLHKPDSTEVDLELDYVGFEIPNLFVIGYGLDYGQIARNLPAIYILDEAEPEG
jgi:hypoxanthine phosphoribosyltransferase